MNNSSRRNQNAESRISRRANNSSPYAKKTSNLPSATVKSSSSFANLFSFLPNPFKRRNGPPQSLPQIEHSQQSTSRSGGESSQEEEEDERVDSRDQYMRGVDDSMDDSRIVEDVLNQSIVSVVSTLTRRGEDIQREQQARGQPSNIPFPRLADNTNTFSSPSPPKRRTAIPPPSTTHSTFRLSELGSPPQNQPTFGMPSSMSMPGNGSPIKNIADFIEARARSGHGNSHLTQNEMQQLNSLISSTMLDDPSLPSAALFGRGFVPSASKSFLAPQQPQPQSSVPTFSIGSSQPPRPTNRSSTRRRPVYVGPGMGSNRPSHRANGMMMNTSRSSILSPIPRSSTFGGATSSKPDGEGTADGKRRRVDGITGNSGQGQQQGMSSSASVPFSFNFGQTQGTQNSGAAVNGTGYERTTVSPQPPSQPNGINGVGAKPSSHATTSNGLLRPPLASSNPPAKPSPLRNMTTATDSPSPPRSITNQTASPPSNPQPISTSLPKAKPQSKTSSVVLGILNDVDQQLSGGNKSRAVEDAVRNPYERVGVKVPVSMATTKKRSVSGGRRKPMEEKKEENDVPSSVRQIEAALPSKRSRGSPVIVNGATTSHAGTSPFLPPPRQSARRSGSATAPTTNIPTYTVDDVDVDEIDEDDDIVEVESIPTQPSRTQRRKTGSFSSGPKSSKRASPPPPIVVEELSSNGSSSSGKPSLVIEPDSGNSNVRYGRSPSLGPPGGQQRFHSPSIPSPLRLVSMPDDPEEEEIDRRKVDVDIVDVDEEDEDVEMDGGKVGALKVPPSSSPSAPQLDEIMEVVDEDEEATTVEDAKEIARNWDVKLLPKFAFDPIVVASTKSFAAIGADSKDQELAKQVEVGKLPVFSFDLKAPVSVTANVAMSSAPVVNNWAAAGWKPASTVAAGEWTCAMCSLKNPATATDKCTICGSDAPTSVKASPAPTAPVTPTINNWAAAGWKPAASSTAREWTCNTCALKNPASATEKCTICGADAPSASAKATPAPSAPITPTTNNWAAAGWKPQTAGPEWTCTSCMLKNPGTEKEKCQICGEKAPASVSGSSAASTSVLASGSGSGAPPLNLGLPSSSFNWAAAGLAQRALPAGSWKCTMCGLTNDAETVECKVCKQMKS